MDSVEGELLSNEMVREYLSTSTYQIKSINENLSKSPGIRGGLGGGYEHRIGSWG